MPGLLQRGAQFGHAPATACSAFSGPAGSLHVSSAICSRQQDDVSIDQLQKFWGEMQIEARRELMRVDKQTVLEQARKNLYCSRCHGLLLQCYSQVVAYGKSLHQEFNGGHVSPKANDMVSANDECDYLQDPSIHPWGGLATTKDGMLTLLDCFICARSLDVLRKVFDSAQHREHDRELLYPDACGDGGRSWINQGLINYARGYGTREACALHTSSLSCDTLVDFWSALGDETRSSLFRMKEDDFIERLMYRFDSKRFCRDCRRNVLREFKELKELKRLKKELHCTSWFCVSDTSVQHELSNESVQADWQQSFTDTHKYHHFEWAIGTAEGKTDILEFENVGLNEKGQANGLDLSHLSACFITVRAWKLDGRCTEICVKAHALKGQTCVHRRLFVGDGFVSITKGDSIKSFFEHAEEVEEEDDDYVDKDGSELDGDSSRPQKHAKSPELAREFLLDAAIVIFKEQVEKAFREGTTRQNSRILFVSLAIKLLEEQLHVACKEIISIQKQIKLLEEEENEKREEGERRERRRNKEREKKLRRKERLKGREKHRETKPIESEPLDFSEPVSASPADTNDEIPTCTHNSRGSITLVETNSTASANDSADSVNLRSSSKESIQKMAHTRVTQVGQAHRSLDCGMNLKNSSRCLTRGIKTNRDRVVRQGDANFIDVRFIKKSLSSHGDYKVKYQHHSPTGKVSKEMKTANTLSSRGDWTRRPPNYNKQRYRYASFGRDSVQTRQVWEPKDAALTNDAVIQQSEEIRFGSMEDHESTTEDCICKHSANAGEVVSRALRCKDSHKSDSCVPIEAGHKLLTVEIHSEVEGSTSSSSTSNIETSSTSDSENASQHSDGKDNSTLCGSSFPQNHNSSPYKKAAVSAFGGGFRYDVVPPQLHMPEMHNNLTLSTLPSKIMDYHYQNPVSWSGSQNSNNWLPFSQQDFYLFPTPVGYSVHGFPEFGMQFNTLQPSLRTSPFHFEQPRVHHGTPVVHEANPNTRLEHAEGRTQELKERSSENKKPAPELPSSVKRTGNSTLKADESSQPFSLFHFGGSLLDSAALAVNRDDTNCWKQESKMKEYSLFAAGSSSRFLFSSFTL